MFLEEILNISSSAIPFNSKSWGLSTPDHPMADAHDFTWFDRAASIPGVETALSVSYCSGQSTEDY